ncbi:MAG: hypothetical protein IT314_10980 [Anaerolineales bacterium]|nr:hypothetical protein [Anaerolineales bacterium]
MKIARIIFYLEVLLSGYAAIMDLINPVEFLAEYTPQKMTGIPLEIIRWYGVQLVPLVYLEFTALWSQRNDRLAWILGAFLIGDFLQIYSTVNYMLAHSGTNWTFGFIFSLVVVLILAVTRIYWLINYRNHSTTSNPEGLT